jgi:secreted trypsin-like serine protease
MKTRLAIGSLLSTLILSLVLTTYTWAQEPAPASGHQKPTPTPTPTRGPIKPQIVGGNPASLNEYPWQAAIVTSSVANPLLGQFCGGSLIDSEWVLTAAHCMVAVGLLTDPADIDVVVGILNLSSGPTSGSTGQRIDVDKIIAFPDYNEAATDSDLALLHLATPATLGSSVNTIGIVGPGDSALFAPGVTATVTGWGATLEGGSGSDPLLEVGLPIISNATCNAPSSYNGAITNNMLCAGFAAGGQDSCQGDSGGPLIVPNGPGRLQAGVVSWGNGCARPNFYGVYTRLAQFKNWIDLQLNGLSSPYILYLPLVLKAPCQASPAGESNNVGDALTVCSGQTVSGQVSASSDFDDVYKISVGSGQKLTISMTGSGGNADLYLYPPNTTNVVTDQFAARSANIGNTEFIQVTMFAGGYWYIDIYSISGVTNYSVTATVTNP